MLILSAPDNVCAEPPKLIKKLSTLPFCLYSLFSLSAVTINFLPNATLYRVLAIKLCASPSP